MRLALIGVGQAGGKIVDRFIEYEDRIGAGFITAAVAINTARTDLEGLRHVPSEHRVLIGGSRTKGHGVGADNELGAEIAEQNEADIQGAVDAVPLTDTDAFLIVAGLGGGTGSGAAPVIARRLDELYSEPVYGLGVLPAEEEGGLYTLNAARSFRTFVNHTDNLLVFDNDAWRSPGESLEEAYTAMNDELVRRFGLLLSAGEAHGAGVAENVVDSSEIINTLQCGGVTTVGYASEQVGTKASDGLLSRFRDNNHNGQYDGQVDRITSLVRKASRGRLTLPCEIDSTDRALIVVSGPPQYLSRRGIERGREWLETEAGTAEVRGGDYPIRADGEVAVAVVLSGVTEVPRIDALQRVAIETQEFVEERDAGRADEQRDLIVDEEDAIDPLF